MVVNEIWFEMKDGRKALIRSPREEDIPGMLDYLLLSAGETEFILRYPEECGKYTYEGEKALFERLNASQEDAMLVCIVDGKVAGSCQITFNQHLKTQTQSERCHCFTARILGTGDRYAPVSGNDRDCAAAWAEFCKWSLRLSKAMTVPAICMKKWDSVLPGSPQCHLPKGWKAFA